MKLVYQYFGNGIALGIYGEQKDIRLLGDYLFNHGATLGDIHWVSDNFGYVLTNKERLQRGIANGAVNARKFESSYIPKQTHPELWPECWQLGKEFVDKLEREDFLEKEDFGETYSNPRLPNEQPE